MGDKGHEYSRSKEMANEIVNLLISIEYLKEGKEVKEGSNREIKAQKE